MAEYCTLVSDDKYAMKAAEAMPLLRLSADTTAISATTSRPCPANHANSKLVAALITAPHISTRITPKRSTITPPRKAPTKVITTPYSLVTVATSSLL